GGGDDARPGGRVPRGGREKALHAVLAHVAVAAIAAAQRHEDNPLRKGARDSGPIGRHGEEGAVSVAELEPGVEVGTDGGFQREGWPPGRRSRRRTCRYRWESR